VSTAGPSLPPPGWHPDPSGRHELRYWDGSRWSEHVSDSGQVAVDDLSAPSPTTTSPEPTLVAPPPSVPATTAAGILDPAAGWGARAPVPGAPPTMMRSIGGLAASLTVVLWITVAVSVFAAIAYLNRISVINDLLDFRGGLGAYYDLVQRGEDADDLVSVASGLGTVCSLTILVLLIIWMWRVAKNALDAGRRDPRFAPGWTIGGWFIPLANLVIPGLILQDLWRGSDPSIERGDPMWRLRAKGSALVGWWWATWVLSLVATVRITGDGDDRDYFERLRVWDSLSAGGQLVRIAAAILLLLVVRRITRRQEALFTGRPVVA